MEPMLQPQVVMGSYQIEADRTRLGNEYLQVGFHPQMGGKNPSPNQFIRVYAFRLPNYSQWDSTPAWIPFTFALSSEDLVKDKVANDRPVWKMRGGERWLYLTTAAGPMELQGRGLTRVASWSVP